MCWDAISNKDRIFHCFYCFIHSIVSDDQTLISGYGLSHIIWLIFAVQILHIIILQRYSEENNTPVRPTRSYTSVRAYFDRPNYHTQLGTASESTRDVYNTTTRTTTKTTTRATTRITTRYTTRSTTRTTRTRNIQIPTAPATTKTTSKTTTITTIITTTHTITNKTSMSEIDQFTDHSEVVVIIGISETGIVLLYDEVDWFRISSVPKRKKILIMLQIQIHVLINMHLYVFIKNICQKRPFSKLQS